jgi:hypothetical protein
MDDAAIAGKDTISPAKFAQSLEKIAPGHGVFFKGEDKAALDGFVNLMRHAERFGQYTENPPTGQRLIPMISLLGAAAWPKLAAAIGGGARAREATTRPALRDALIRASHAKLGIGRDGEARRGSGEVSCRSGYQYAVSFAAEKRNNGGVGPTKGSSRRTRRRRSPPGSPAGSVQEGHGVGLAHAASLRRAANRINREPRC